MRGKSFYLPLFLLLTACPPQPKPTRLDMAPPGASCVSNAVTSQVEVGYFTSTYVQCVNCTGVAGCFDGNAGIYCCAGPCMRDPMCSFQTPGQQ